MIDRINRGADEDDEDDEMFDVLGLGLGVVAGCSVTVGELQPGLMDGTDMVDFFGLFCFGSRGRRGEDGEGKGERRGGGRGSHAVVQSARAPAGHAGFPTKEPVPPSNHLAVQ